jgi:hypothetical protein
VEQVVKWEKGNDLWAAVEPATKSSALLDTNLLSGIPEQVKSLISEFDPIFQEPTKLPPPRACDHSITLLPNAAPINCRPYRYSPNQKDEIERHVAAMLKAGTIIPSLSPFAAPVLLV